MPLAECQQRVSHREFQLWRRWFRCRLEVPERSDYYLMQLCQLTDGLRTGKLRPLDQYLLRFRTESSKPRSVDESKQCWIRCLGGPKAITIRRITPERSDG